MHDWPLRRVCLRLSYDGTGYHGWQRQEKIPNTIQGRLNEALFSLFDQEICADGASRTDAGVHAHDQLVAFTFRHPMKLYGICRGLNRRLPAQIAAREVVEVPLDFLPRFENRGKIYCYRLFSQSTPDPLRERFATRVHYTLNPEQIAEAMAAWIGTHDFKSFAATSGQHDHTIRTLWHVSMRRVPHHGLELRFGGTGFLKQMVRNFVGTLIDIGRGRRDVESALAVLQARDRQVAGSTAPPQGLTLERTLWP
jgi:tRNA pseudouridine38-40 synthase